jgi:hypothetical protein
MTGAGRNYPQKSRADYENADCLAWLGPRRRGSARRRTGVGQRKAEKFDPEMEEMMKKAATTLAR